MIKQNDALNEKLPIKKLIPLGLQHILAMYAGAVMVPLIVGKSLGLTSEQIATIISIDLFVCGLSTLIQVIGIGKFAGIKLPVVLGCSFTAVGPMIIIGKDFGIGAVYGSIICGGLFVLIISPLFGKLLKFFPTVVVGSVITLIGLSLIPVAINNAAGGIGSPNFGNPKNLAIALFVIIVIILINKFSNGFMQAISILIGIVAGTILAYILGMLDFSSVSNASFFKFSAIPFTFGKPTFVLSAIITMCLVSLVSMIESTGVFFATGNIVGKDIKEKDIVKGLRAEGLAQVIGGIFNTFPYTTFSQNVGVISLTGVKSKFVVIAAGYMLMILSFFPKFASLAIIIPTPVLGGAMIVMFGTVAIAGIRTLSTVDFSNNNNLLVAACSIAVGLGVAVVPGIFGQMPQMFKILFESGIVSGSVTAIILNIVLNWTEIKNSSDNTSMHEDID